MVLLEAECSMRCWILGSASWMCHLQTSWYFSTAGIDSCSPHTGQLCHHSFYPVVLLSPQKVLEVSSYREVQEEMSRLMEVVRDSMNLGFIRAEAQS